MIYIVTEQTHGMEKENEEFFNFNFFTDLQADFRFFFQFLILYFPFLTKLVIRFNTKKMSANNKLASYCFTVGGSEPD